jgi:FMN-dependent NADH-azoreductase
VLDHTGADPRIGLRAPCCAFRPSSGRPFDPTPFDPTKQDGTTQQAISARRREADTVVLGLPLYNYGVPSSVKAWVDHLVAGGLSHDPATGAGLLAGRDFVVIATRGGGYGEGTPREGWDHAETWLPHGVSITGLEPRFITAELTLAGRTPAMADLVPLAEKSLALACQAIDDLWPAQERTS